MSREEWRTLLIWILAGLIFLFWISYDLAGAQQVYYTRDTFAAPYKSDLQLAMTYIKQNDIEALAQLKAQGRILIMRPGIPVFIMKEENRFIKIRIQGKQSAIWTTRRGVTHTRPERKKQDGNKKSNRTI